MGKITGTLKSVRRAIDEFDPRFDPRKKEQERLSSLETTVAERGTQDADRIPLSSLEGEDFVTSMSDRTAAGGYLTGINDVELARQVNLQGGQGFMLENPGMVWASAAQPVKQILKSAAGDDTLYLPWRMAPTGGDFATKTGETMLAFAQASLTKKAKRSLDKLIKTSIPDWKGIDAPEAIDLWRASPDRVRKQLMNDMDVRFRDDGGLSIGEARLAVSDPDQLTARDGGIQNIGRVHGDKAPVVDSGHPSYPHGVPGEGLGKTDQDVGIFELLPDVVAERGIPDPLNPRATDLRALQMKPYRGTISESVLRSLEERGIDINSLPPTVIASLAGLGAATQSEDSEAVPIMKGGKKIIEAFHGSPHKFDKFSMENIGTGEGAQAYGHGLYFADSEDVARGYRDGLTARIPPKRGYESGGERFYQGGTSDDWLAADMANNASRGKFDSDADFEEWLEGELSARYMTNPWDFDPDYVADRTREFHKQGVTPFTEKPDGSLYRVHLDVDPDTLLDWDKPLSEQSEAVQSLYRELSAPTPDDLALLDELGAAYDDVPEEAIPSADISGQQLYQMLSDRYGSHFKTQEGATQFLRERGIPGIRYLDGNSRNAGEGSYNYVMFDDKPISIQERGMATPEMLTATAAGTFLATREQRKGQWESLRDDLLESAGRAANFVFESAEIPWKGILGLTRLGGGMASGEGFPDALNAAVEQIQQPVDQTAHNLGGAMTDATGSPAMGTAVNLGVNLGGPI